MPSNQALTEGGADADPFTHVLLPFRILEENFENVQPPAKEYVSFHREQAAVVTDIDKAPFTIHRELTLHKVLQESVKNANIKLTRRDAALSFLQVLVLKTLSIIDVKQVKI